MLFLFAQAEIVDGQIFAQHEPSPLLVFGERAFIGPRRHRVNVKVVGRCYGRERHQRRSFINHHVLIGGVGRFFLQRLIFQLQLIDHFFELVAPFAQTETEARLLDVAFAQAESESLCCVAAFTQTETEPLIDIIAFTQTKSKPMTGIAAFA